VGSRADDAFLELRALLVPFGVAHYYSDKQGAYRRHLPAEQYTTGRRSLCIIETEHRPLQSRLKRLAGQTLYFSQSIEMHDLVTGLFMNLYGFGRAV
jgi:insertion element IS1 protein InsB